MIKLNYDVLTDAIGMLQKIALEVVLTAEPLQESRGSATDTENQIIDMLQEICKKDIPNLMEQTNLLLESIRNEFKESEQTIITKVINRSSQ
jgi:plasmid replication initiation protein